MDCLIAQRILYRKDGKLPTAEEVAKLFEVIGVKKDIKMIKDMLSKLEGKEQDELIKEGISKIQVTSSAPAQQSSEEKKVEQKKEESEEEEEDDDDLDLFG